MKSDEFYMKKAIEMAKEAGFAGEIPVGAVLVMDDKIIAKGRNHKEEKLDVTSHAEVEAIKKAAKKLKTYRLNKATLYVTLEPCVFCMGAIRDSKIKRIVFGATDPKKGAVVSNYHLVDDFKSDYQPLITRGILAIECEEILNSFFETKRD